MSTTVITSGCTSDTDMVQDTTRMATMIGGAIGTLTGTHMATTRIGRAGNGEALMT